MVTDAAPNKIEKPYDFLNFFNKELKASMQLKGCKKADTFLKDVPSVLLVEVWASLKYQGAYVAC